MTVSVETLSELEGADALLERLGRVPSPTARRLLCDGTLTRIILDPSGEPIDIAGCGRSHTTGQAKALALLHPTCAFPGCAVPFRMCHIHHVEHWIDGGPTELANLVPLCGTHHRFHHEGGYTITSAPGRMLSFRDPLSRTIPDPDAALDRTTGQLALTVRSDVGARPHGGDSRPALPGCDAQRGSRRRDRWSVPGPPYG